MLQVILGYLLKTRGMEIRIVKPISTLVVTVVLLKVCVATDSQINSALFIKYYGVSQRFIAANDISNLITETEVFQQEPRTKLKAYLFWF